jgi:hypothetical protein
MRLTATILRIAVLTVFTAAAQDHPLPLSIADGRLAPPPGAPVVAVTVTFSAAVSRPVEAMRLDRTAVNRRWHLADIVRTLADDGRITVRGPAGVETLLVVRLPGHPGYLLDGPFRWPVQPATYYVGGGWRRTVRGRTPRAGAGPLEWVSATDQPPREAWPACEWTTQDEWECVGVPLKEPGIVLAAVPGHVSYFESTGVVDQSGIETPVARTAVWGRLVVVSFAASTLEGATTTTVTARRMHPPPARPQSVRLDVEQDTRVSVDRLSARSFWLSGAQPPEDGWVEVMAVGRAPVRLETREVAGAPPSLPLRVDLEPAASIAGRVSAGPGMVAKDAVVSLYRFVGDSVKSEKRAPRRILLAETRTGDDGEFRFDNLAVERYEVVAMHSTYGRVERVVEPDGQEVDLELRRPPHAVGRVLRDGVPAAGVHVVVMPDLGVYAASEDVTELRGGEDTTGEDGHFSVGLASRGAAEVRIGDVHTGIRRISVGAAETLPRIVDLGTIELAPVPPVTLVLEASDGCDLLLTGPAGRAGMAVISARRIGPAMFEARVSEPGRWMVVAVCARRERAVVPAFVDVPAAARDMSIRLSWPLQLTMES